MFAAIRPFTSRKWQSRHWRLMPYLVGLLSAFGACNRLTSAQAQTPVLLPATSAIMAGAPDYAVGTTAIPTSDLNTFRVFDVSSAPAPTDGAAAVDAGTFPTSPSQFPTPPSQVFLASAVEQSPVVRYQSGAGAAFNAYTQLRMMEGANHYLRITPAPNAQYKHSPLHNFTPVSNADGTAAAPPPGAVMHYRKPDGTGTPPPAATSSAMVPPMPGDGGATTPTPSPTADNTWPTIEASATARVAVFGDTTHMNGMNDGTFLPANIPVGGQPFYGGPPRANGTATGSLFNLTGGQQVTNSMTATGSVSVVATENGSDLTASVQQATLQLSNLVVGLGETALADPDAVPLTLDLAGPNSRVTVYTDGITKGQGRLSYYFVRAPTDGGLDANFSVEEPNPEIVTTATGAKSAVTSTFARFPDLISTWHYGPGLNALQFHDWHVQFGTVVRDLGLENGTETLVRNSVGWGLSLGGHYSFVFNPEATQLPEVLTAAIIGGQGIAHYMDDLHSTGSAVGNDAVLTNDHSLDALTALGYSAGYTHYWFENLRSTASYSHVYLDSIATTAETVSPYRSGDYFSINLTYGILTADSIFLPQVAIPKTATGYHFVAGLEYLYGRKETLDGNAGHDQRVMMVVSIDK